MGSLAADTAPLPGEASASQTPSHQAVTVPHVSTPAIKSAPAAIKSGAAGIQRYPTAVHSTAAPASTLRVKSGAQQPQLDPTPAVAPAPSPDPTQSLNSGAPPFAPPRPGQPASTPSATTIAPTGAPAGNADHKIGGPAGTTKAAGTSSASKTASTPAPGKALSTAGMKTTDISGKSAVAPAKHASQTSKAPSSGPTAAKLTQISELEKLMFGEAHPSIPIEYRLDRLESEVFHHTNPEWDATKRINRLSDTLLGTGGPGSGNGSSGNTAGGGTTPGSSSTHAPHGRPETTPLQDAASQQEEIPPLNSSMPAPLQSESQPYIDAAAANLNSPEFQKVIPRGQLEKYGLEEINTQRASRGLAPLEWDDLAYKVATELVNDLCKRNTVTHQNAAGENPDIRYTKAGGTDSIVESIMAEKVDSKPTPNKAMVFTTIGKLMKNQDDREALLSPHATGMALNFNLSSGRDKLITCFEVVTKHAEISEIPSEVKVGDKIEITGVMRPGYNFKKITVAWEGLDNSSGDAEEQDEALPYFAPLDYEAYARKSEHDWDKATRLLQIGGIGLALAGGLFIPPVALAAPLIAASAGTMKPHAVSDIPVRGGVRVDGAMFTHRIPISKNEKDGIYYITVWASTDSDDKPVPISRRAIVAKITSSGTTSEISKETPKSSSSGKNPEAGGAAGQEATKEVTGDVHGTNDKALLSDNRDEHHTSKKGKHSKDKKRAKGISAEQNTERE